MKNLVLITSLVFAVTSTAAIAHGGGNAAVDQKFVTKAAQGGMAEVALGRLATEQGNSDSTKQFGRHMVDDHSKANDELKSTATAAGAKVPDAPSAAQKTMANSMAAKKGPSFDAAYAQAMVKDHQDTIALFEREVESGHNDALKTFASDTLPTLKAHLQMAQDLQAKTN